MFCEQTMLRTFVMVTSVVCALGVDVWSDVFHMPDGLQSLETVMVGDAGNPADDTGFGAVKYPFQIGRFEITAAQYAEFLNAKAKTSDPYHLRNNNMEESGGCGIQRTGKEGSYVYKVASDFANLPVNHVSYWDACRFCNWLHNGQGDGDTENGAYALNGYTGSDGRKIRRNPGAKWFVPSEDEWYKAAYYDPQKSGGPGYWEYPTRSNSQPGRDFSSPNAVNYYNGSYVDPVHFLTKVGSFTRAKSGYGTFDQGGNVYEWNESLIPTLFRGVRGSSWATNDAGRKFRCPRNYGSEAENDYIGFRVAGAVEGIEALPPQNSNAIPGEMTTSSKFARRPWRNPETGKVFFPLGWFAWGANESDLRAMAREGANTLLYVNAPTDLDRGEEQFKLNLNATQKLLDQAHENGMKILLQCSWYDAFRDNNAAYQERVQRYITAISRHPGLLGYQLFDEPEYKGGGSMKETDIRTTTVFVDCLTKEYQAIHAWDTNRDHLVQVVFNNVPFSGWSEFLPAIDAFQIDRYPCDSSQAYFGHRGDWGPLIMAWSIAHGREATIKTGQRNPCPVLQGIGLNYNEDGYWWRTPLYEETRYMAYSTLTVGGWGCMHWIWEASVPDIREHVGRLYAELRQLLPALEQSYENPPFTVTHNHQEITRTFLTDSIPDITVLPLEDARNYYLIVSDNSRLFEDVTLRLQLPPLKDGKSRKALVLNESWSRNISYNPNSGDWIIEPHKMCFGDINIWVISKE
jgi:formylglycine-generating enzyme